ncbi:MAG TPA: putative Ig domain-containing protein, partial [Bryobacteraceae bacterium]|nr:putative Ig domain-containing protein [Bryobacteraceae bacterium]
MRIPSLLFVFLMANIASAQLRINSNTALTGATVSQAYGFSLVASGGTAPYTFALAGGALPTGLNLDPGGAITGVPSASGDFSFQVRATDAVSATVVKGFTLNVAPTALQVQPSINSGYTTGELSSASFSATGGRGPYNFSILSGTLPTGWDFTKSTCFCYSSGFMQGVIRTAGTYSFVALVTDSDNRTATAVMTTTATDVPLYFSSLDIGGGTIGADYSGNVRSSSFGGFGPLVFTMVSALPPGLQLTTGGILRGIPTATGSFDLQIRATDALGNTALASGTMFVYSPEGLSITSTSPLPTAVQGVSFSKQFVVADFGGAVTAGTWSAPAGVPPGLNLSSTGLLSGTPSSVNSFSFNVLFTPIDGSPVSKTFALTVSPFQFQWTSPTNLPPLNRGQYSVSSLGTSGPAFVPSSIEMILGSWPGGMTPGLPLGFNGTPITAGTNNFTLEATAVDGQIASKAFTQVVQPTPALTILSSALPTATRGVRYSFLDFPATCSCAANGGAHPYRWSLASGSLPSGLTLYADGEIAGIPAQAGSFPITLQLTDGYGTIVTRAFTLTVLDASGSFSITTPSPLPQGIVGQPYSQQIQTSGGTPGFTWSVSAGSLPPGFALTSTGLLQSVGPVSTPGTFNFTIQVVDNSPESSGGPLTASRSFSLTLVRPPPVITSINPSSAVALSPGFNLVVTGQNFFNPEQSPRVTWNGQDLATTFNSVTQLTALVPASLLTTAGTIVVRVRNPDNALSNSLPFTITPNVPTLTRLVPDIGDAGSPEFILSVEATNIRPNMFVEFNGQTLLTYAFTPDLIRAVVPASALQIGGVFPVRVRTPEGFYSNVLNFIVRGAEPAITSIDPASAAAGSPQLVLTVDGTAFQSGSLVQWNGAALTTDFVSPTRITAIVPATLLLNPGAAAVTVLNPGNVVSAARSFFITGLPPQILSLNPSTAPAGSPQLTLLVNGNNFQNGALVRWNGQDLVTTFVAANQLSAVVPVSLLVNPGLVPVIVRNADGQTSAPSSFTVTGAATAPQITSLNPGSTLAGGPAFTLSVAGANFENGAIVNWNGSPLVTAFGSSTALTAQVPAALITAVSSNFVTVVNPGGASSAPATFTVSATPAPQISSLNPASAVAGGPAFTLNVSGTNFQNGSIVRWNGTLLPTTFVSAVSLTAQVSAALIASAGAIAVTVANPGSTSAPATFVVSATPPPQITSLNPGAAIAGSPAFAITVLGANFQNGAVVQWNGAALSTTFVNAGSLLAQVPAILVTAPSVNAVTVVNPGAVASAPAAFTVSTSVLPVISSLNPASILAVGPSFLLTVLGANFQNGAVVQWNGTPLATTFVNSGSLTATVDAGLIQFPGAASITVRNPNGGTSNAAGFSIQLLQPSITGISPLGVVAGTPEPFSLTVFGVNFRTGAVITWNGQPLPTAFVSTTQLIAGSVSPGLFARPGAVSIGVRNPGGQASVPVTFTVVAPQPLITGLTPSTAIAGTPGFSLVVSGTGFLSTSVVRWNGSPVPTTFAAGQLTAIIDTALIASAGSASITVVNGGTQVSNSVTLTIAPALTPEITQLMPSSAAVNSPSFQLTIQGRNFISTSQVQWNGAALLTSFVSATQLTAIVPPAFLTSPGAVSITVRNSDARISLPAAFAVGDPLRITSAAELIIATAGSVYQTSFTASGGARPYRWRVAAGSEALPPGLTLSEDGTLRGTPANDGPFSFTIEVLDATGATDRQRASLRILPRDLEISSTSPLPPATAGVPYSFRFQANVSATGALSWSVIEGTLPAGLSLNAQTGEISGIAEEPPEPDAARGLRTASVPVTFAFRIQVAAQDRNPGRKQFELSVLPAAGGFRIVTPSPLPDGAEGKPVRVQINAVGGSVPYGFTLTGRLPAGVSFNSDGLLAGVPTEIGTFTLTINARDGSQATASQTYEWRVLPSGDGPTISSGPQLPLSPLNQNISILLEAAGGFRPYTWSVVSGTLPAGLVFDPVLGRLSGTAQEEGLFVFTARVTDANGLTDTRSLLLPLTLTGEPLQIVTPSLPATAVGRSYNIALDARGGKGPYTWTISSGALPSGIQLTGTQLSGSPTGPGTGSFTLRVVDAFGI